MADMSQNSVTVGGDEAASGRRTLSRAAPHGALTAGMKHISVFTKLITAMLHICGVWNIDPMRPT